MKPQSQRRAAFDIGSGATKLVVAEVVGSHVTTVLFGEERPVPFAIEWKKSADGRLSDAIQAQGLAVLRALLEVCRQHGVEITACRAVATEVFRKAANGGDFLQAVQSQLGLAVEVVSQEVEAELGFRTAVALQDAPPQDIVCWDSGGASFQITSLDPAGGSLRSWVGALGSGNTTAMLVEGVQGHAFAERATPNPVSATEAESLIAKLRSELLPVPDWLRGASVTAIGGPNSMFCVANEALHSRSYTVSEARRALVSVLDLPDAEMAAKPFCQGELKEPPGLIVPKVCLLVAVMEHAAMAAVHFCPSIGSCQGLLISD
eukprot:CAMPEP_0176023944 /NCGR_PEP_ID=MMETSP0120_2-20121206/11689_1 /TAXON_ID=160619 /ORGANISM="Kryptoperidinium foliaceum, Strain CCMP 1326" /LENGTH=318 /DNA_ID=CAMNT_0017357111 /DNA_START=38 /DNA_END=991 /DNA_ORIENTATION=-